MRPQLSLGRARPKPQRRTRTCGRREPDGIKRMLPGADRSGDNSEFEHGIQYVRRLPFWQGADAKARRRCVRGLGQTSWDKQPNRPQKCKSRPLRAARLKCFSRLLRVRKYDQTPLACDRGSADRFAMAPPPPTDGRASKRLIVEPHSGIYSCRILHAMARHSPALIGCWR